MHDGGRLVLIRSLREARFAGRIAMRSHDAADARMMLDAGADVILAPFSDATVRAAELISFAGASPFQPTGGGATQADTAGRVVDRDNRSVIGRGS